MAREISIHLPTEKKSVFPGTVFNPPVGGADLVLNVSDELHQHISIHMKRVFDGVRADEIGSVVNDEIALLELVLEENMIGIKLS